MRLWSATRHEVGASTHSAVPPVAPCGLRCCKNRPAPFPGRMSYKANQPDSCLSRLLAEFYEWVCCSVNYAPPFCAVLFCYFKSNELKFNLSKWAAYEINNDNIKQWKSHITTVQKGSNAYTWPDESTKQFKSNQITFICFSS